MKHEIVNVGDATLYCGDCLEILPRLRDAGVDAVVTDPPYGVSLKGKRTKSAVSRHNKGYVDFSDDPDLVRKVAIPAVQMCVEMFGRVVVTPGTRLMWEYPKPDDVGGVFNANGAGRGRWGFTCIHPILYYGTDPYLQKGMGSRANGFSDLRASGAPEDVVKGHPCPKPLRWMEWMVKKAALPDQTVLDPFMGSGTTGVACSMLGRKFIGIEINPTYFKLAIKRLRRTSRVNALWDE